MGLAAFIGRTESGIWDLGLKCCPHSRNGTISTGSEDVFIEKHKAARLNDSGGCNCPHSGTFKISSGSSKVFINGRASVRIGDSTTCMNCGCGGSIVTGSKSVYIG